MFKLFKNRILSFFFTSFILFFAQTLESNAHRVEDRFQEGMIVVVSGKNTVMKLVDMPVIGDAGGHGEDELAFGKVEKVSLFNVLWGGVGIVSLLASLCTANICGVVVSIMALFC
ncbi:hypothetical protein MF1_09990 [Bartonella quintana]|uniref:hypothetical protein n=1 Tax=Bartonella quintana TaxID=803 RepID=UPI00030D4791|nr:hypothetical protein [Bartonella quintana]BBL53741.1 hypothetical protein MF1_09990 [Bartonella quintana]